MSLFEELKRRNVFRVGVAYAVAAWVFLQVLDLVMEYVAAPIWVMHLSMMLLAAGFPAVLIGAWLFEITPEGIKRERDVERRHSITTQTGRKLDQVVIVFLIIAVVFLLADRFTFTDPANNEHDEGSGTSSTTAEKVTDPKANERATQKSIAVLPFRDMSAARDQAYFGEGIAEELLNALVKLKGIKVASRTSSFSLAGENLDIPAIAERLGVNHVLEGSVRTAGNQVRVTAQLIDVAEDMHLWSETYDGSLDDIFQIQDEITGKITSALQLQLGGPAPASAARTLTTNAEAYQLYLQGRHLWRQRNGPAMEQSVDLFQRAVALDPSFHQAWSNLAVAYAILPNYVSDTDVEKAFEQGLAAADRALELAPDSTEARLVRSSFMESQCQYLEAADEYEKAISADPDDPTARHWYGIMLLSAGRTEAATEQIELAKRLDPLISAVTAIQAWAAGAQGRYPQAVEFAQEASSLGFRQKSPDTEGLLTIMSGQLERGANLMRQAAAQAGTEALRHQWEAVASSAEDARHLPELVDYLRSLPGNNPTTVSERADLLAALGSDQAIGLLNSLTCPRIGQLIWAPPFRKHRRSPEFFSLMERAGLVDYWRKYGWPDDCASLDQDLAECPE